MFQRLFPIPLRVAACLFGVLVSTCVARAETKLDFWHYYIHQPSGIVHYSFQIANYKRGLFFGSCGPSTRSLQWGYDIDLAGPGPVYQKEQITITSDATPVEVVSGTIRYDAKSNQAILNLRVRSTAGELVFPGNGTHSIKKIK